MSLLTRSLNLIALSLLLSAAHAEEPARIAVISAFEPEWRALVGKVAEPKTQKINGVSFVTGKIENKPVVLMMSGISMVNAAMNSQLLLDHFPVKAILFSGIAGGADPDLKVGDVAVPERWRESLETVFARETPGGFKTGEQHGQAGIPNFLMMFPNGVQVASQDNPLAYHDFFTVDAGLLALARKVADQVTLEQCRAPGNCFDHRPRVSIGGTGVSGSAFIDNRAFREYLFSAYHAEVIDMESAAVAQVAFANQKPFIAFRSLSDLAGGDETENQMNLFMDLAATNSAKLVVAFIKAD